MTFKAKDFNFMELDAKWLFVSGIPILLALFLGGYVKNFKGFGIELEADLKSPLPASLIKTVAYEKIISINKEGVYEINSLTPSERRKIKSLKFVLRKRDYYDVWAIEQYLYGLEFLQFLEIVNSKGQLEYLLPVSTLKSGNEVNNQAIRNFIVNIERFRLDEKYSNAISEKVSISDSLIIVYKRMMELYPDNSPYNDFHVLPVINKKGQMIGVILKSEIERRILDDVVKNFD